MKVEVKFTVDVDWCDGDRGTPAAGSDVAKRIEESVEEAVGNALAHAQGEGHLHQMRDEISILMDSEISAKLAD